MLRKKHYGFILGALALSLFSCSKQWAGSSAQFTYPPPLFSTANPAQQNNQSEPTPVSATQSQMTQTPASLPVSASPGQPAQNNPAGSDLPPASNATEENTTVPELNLDLSPDPLNLQTQTPEASPQETTSSSENPLEIRLFRSYGHEKLVHLSGRIVRPEEEPPVSADDSKWTNFWRNLQELSVNEVSGVKVRFKLNGHSLTLSSDDEGMLTLSTATFGELTPGEHELTAELVPGQEYSAPPAHTTITIHSRTDTSPSLVSDIDDTLVKTQVSDKLQAMKNFLLDNSLSSDLIPGTSELYQALEQNFDGKVDGDIFYLSGSPLNFADRIYQLLDTHAYPTGAVTLKKWGFGPNDDNPIQQNDYKQKALRKLLLTYPHKPFYFFGDSGEHDPEIYREIAAEFPDQVKGIFINNVTAEQPDQARFQGVYLTRHTVDAAQILLGKGLLTAADVSRVHKALLTAASQVQDDD